MSLAKYESEVKPLCKSQQAVYERLSDLRNLEALRSKMNDPKVRESILPVIRAPFVFPPDIIETLREDAAVWEHYRKFSESYRRIRIAYIEAARNRPGEFRKRLISFMEKTRQGKLITGYGGVEKYYR